MGALKHKLLAPDAIRKEFERLSDFPWSRVDLDGFPVPLYLCFAETPDGRVVISGLMLSPGVNTEISARALREIPLGRLLALPKWGLLPGYVKSAKAYRPPRIAAGPTGRPLEHFVKVAAAYRQTLKSHPRTPIRALMTQLHCSEPTAHRWLQRCRDLGLLGKKEDK
jgi:hypothetical protein